MTKQTELTSLIRRLEAPPFDNQTVIADLAVRSLIPPCAACSLGNNVIMPLQRCGNYASMHSCRARPHLSDVKSPFGGCNTNAVLQEPLQCGSNPPAPALHFADLHTVC